MLDACTMLHFGRDKGGARPVGGRARTTMFAGRYCARAVAAALPTPIDSSQPGIGITGRTSMVP